MVRSDERAGKMDADTIEHNGTAAETRRQEIRMAGLVNGRGAKGPSYKVINIRGVRMGRKVGGTNWKLIRLETVATHRL